MTIDEAQIEYNLSQEEVAGLKCYVELIKTRCKKEVFVVPSRPSGLNTIFYTVKPIKIKGVWRGNRLGYPNQNPDTSSDEYKAQMLVLQGKERK